MPTGESDDRILPTLREAEDVADDTLAKACAATAPSKADTGELIQIDELLESASEAVKRAISLRRRRRAEEAAQDVVRATMSAAEAEASADATHRIFRDARGVRWDVFAVYPQPRLSAEWHVAAPYSRGWLCFDSVGQKRRLSPVPSDWLRLSNVQLEQLGNRAEAVPTRTDRPRGTSSPDSRPSS